MPNFGKVPEGVPPVILKYIKSDKKVSEGVPPVILKYQNLTKKSQKESLLSY